MKMQQFNKKGASMVEAALIYPILLAAMMAVIYMLIAMYSATAVKAHIHTTLREQSLLATGTGERIEVKNSFLPADQYSADAFNQKINVTEEKGLYYSRLHGTTQHTYGGNSFLKEIRRSHEGSVYVIDEKDMIRKVDLITNEAME